MNAANTHLKLYISSIELFLILLLSLLVNTLLKEVDAELEGKVLLPEGCQLLLVLLHSAAAEGRNLSR